MRHVDGRVRWLARALLVMPLGILGLASCTWSDLSSLGAGSPDAGGPEDAGGTPPVLHDAGADSAVNPPIVDSGPPPPPVDSGSPPPVDAGSDAPVSEDSGSTAPPAALPIWLDAGTASWCDLHPGYAFCADFDETPLPAGFSASDGAYLYQTSSRSSSAPNDLLLNVPAQTGGGTWGSKLSRQFSTPASSVVLAFDFDPEVLNSSSTGILFAGLDFLGNSNAKYSVRLAYNQGAPRLEESYLGSPSDVYHSNFTVSTNAWSRIQVELTFPATVDGGASADAAAPPSATESIYVNGVLQGTVETLTPPVGFDQAPNLLIGAVYGTNPTNGWALRYDNVTLDIQ